MLRWWRKPSSPLMPLSLTSRSLTKHLLLQTQWVVAQVRVGCLWHPMASLLSNANGGVNLCWFSFSGFGF